MSEKRFIQLINLYIDGEISPEELEELENEVSRDGRRREIYHSYRRLQQASHVAYREHGSALAEGVDLKKYQILARGAGRRLHRGLMYSAGALAAACLTVVAAVSLFHDSHWRSSGGAGQSVQTANGTTVEVFEPGARQRRTDRLQLAGAEQAEPFFFAGRPTSEKRTEFLDPARPRVRDAFRLSTKSSAWVEEFGTSSSPKVIRGAASFEAGAELASFQFQR